MKPPDGLEPLAGPKGWGFAAPEAAAWAAGVLQDGDRLRDAAAAHPAVLELVGRGAVFALPAPGGRWVVRPYRRGGWLAAPLLGDRHLRLGVARPVAEAHASAEATRRGIPTPRVLAGAVYPAGPFYRADLVTEYIADSQDLAATLFQPPPARDADRSRALREAGRLIGRMARAGVEHPDMNARNILLVPGGGAAEAVLLDLDRCRVRRAAGGVSADAMLRRLERSLRRLAAGSGAAWRDRDTVELRRGVAAS